MPGVPKSAVNRPSFEANCSSTEADDSTCEHNAPSSETDVPGAKAVGGDRHPLAISLKDLYYK